jgi:hypothetical protein
MPDNRHICSAGEYFVAAELSRRGITCALTRNNALGVDILATVDGSKSMTFQVKASAGRGDSRKWAVGKNNTICSASFFYVFVNVWTEPSRPHEVFIVPSSVVCDRLKNRVSSMPTFRLRKDEVGSYRNNWKPVADYFGLELE